MSNSFGLYSENQIPPFPAYVRPKYDELFSSWLVRLSHAHLMKVHTFTKLSFPNQQFWNRDIDRSVSDEAILKLSQKTNTSFKELFNTTLRSFEGSLLLSHNINTGSKWLMPLGVYHRTWRNYGLVYCPECLKNDNDTPYFRKNWRLSFLVVCDKCGIEMCDRCPECESPISFFRADLGKKSEEVGEPIKNCYKCKTSLTSAGKIEIDEAFVIMQRNLLLTLTYGWNENVIYPFLYFDVLRNILTLISGNRRVSIILRESIMKILNLEYKSMLGGYKNRFEVLTLKDRRELLLCATWLLEEWPVRYIEIIKPLKIYSSDLLKEMVEVPYWYSKVIMENFYVSNVNRRFKK